MAFTPIFGTGFELGSMLFYGPQGYSSIGGAVSTSQKKSGTYSAGLGDRETWSFNLTDPLTDIYIEFWAKNVPVNTNGATSKFYIYTGTTYLALDLTTSIYGKIDYYLGATKIGTGVRGNANNWQNYNIHIVISDTVGSFDVKIDGISDLAYTGDTKPGTETTVTKFSWLSGWNNGFYIDDLVIGTDGWPEDIRFMKLVPTTDTTQKDFTRSTGSDNYPLVDEVPPSSTDYVYASTNGHKDFYNITDFEAVITGNTLVPKFVMHWVQAWKDPVNSQKFKFLQKLGTTENASSATDVSATPSSYFNLRTVDPDGNAWTDSNLDSLQIGQEAVI